MLSDLVSSVSSGIADIFNKLVASGILLKTMLVAFLTFVVSFLFSGIAGLISGAGTLVNVASVFAQLGMGGQIAAWGWSIFIGPFLVPVIGGLVARFVIRRLPFVG